MAAEHVRIHRHAATGRFCIIPNELAQNEDLSWAARGLLVHLLSLPQDWTIRICDLLSRGKGHTGKSRLYSIKRELEAAGYMRGYRVRDRRGLITQMVWEITDVPHAWPEPASELGDEAQNPVGSPQVKKQDCGQNPVGSPQVDFPEGGYPDGGYPDGGKPPSGFPPTTNTDRSKTIDHKNGGEKEAHPPAAAIWDSQAMQYGALPLPWLDRSKHIDQGFLAWLTDLWSKDKDRASAASMAKFFIRKATGSEADYLRVSDHWQQFQQHQAEQAERIEAERIAAEEAAERARWLG